MNSDNLNYRLMESSPETADTNDETTENANNNNYNNNSEKSNNTPVKKRSDNNKKSNIMSRFSKIVSVYVPSDESERVLLNFHDDYNNNQGNQKDYCPQTLLQTLDEDITYQVEYFANFKTVFGRSTGIVKSCCAIVDKLFLVFESESQIYRLEFNKTELVFDGIWIPKFHDHSIVPIEIRCTHKHIFVSGTINPQPNKTLYLIVKFDYEENVVACTKRYAFPKFSKFDIDKDDNLIILSEQLDDDSQTSQVSKLTGGFESRPYYITLGATDCVYKPLYVAAHGANGKAWVTMEKITKETEESESRLMCFQCCISKADGNKTSLKSQLECSRWRLSGFNLGPLATVDNNVVAIDLDKHNLCHISWNKTDNIPIVKTISAAGSPHMVNLCTIGPQEVFLFTNSNVFRFTFIEQLIKAPNLII